MKGPSAIPTTPERAKIDIGKLRALSPFQISVIVPPTTLMAIELAPPAKNRVTRIVAKFGDTAEGISQMRKKMYDT